MARLFWVAAGAMLALPLQAATPPETIVIGCLSRAGQAAYVLTDARSGAAFRIVADGSSPARTLDWQVGHQLEIHGTVGPSSDSPRQLTASTVLTIATRCTATSSPRP